jgi:hypothetical protein
MSACSTPAVEPLTSALIEDRDDVCDNCKKTMSVCAQDRLSGGWTRYGRRFVNRHPAGYVLKGG